MPKLLLPSQISLTQDKNDLHVFKVHKILLGSALFELFEIKTIKETKKTIKPRLNVILEG
jgi:hypothetical protein